MKNIVSKNSTAKSQIFPNPTHLNMSTLLQSAKLRSWPFRLAPGLKLHTLLTAILFPSCAELDYILANNGRNVWRWEVFGWV